MRSTSRRPPIEGLKQTRGAVTSIDLLLCLLDAATVLWDRGSYVKVFSLNTSSCLFAWELRDLSPCNWHQIGVRSRPGPFFKDAIYHAIVARLLPFICNSQSPRKIAGHLLVQK
jgi:hypothetical protein